MEIDVIQIISGVVIGGVAGIVAKDKLFGADTKSTGKQQEIDSLYAENEKFSRRNKELERQVEDLLSELNKLRKKARDNDDEHDDLEDELDKVKRELKSIRQQNEVLTRKVKEYQTLCEAKEAEISLLKEKMG